MTTITKPRRKYNRQAARRHRKRAVYPDLETLRPGQACDIERKECGINRGLPTIDPVTLKTVPGRISHGSYVFEHLLPRRSRNRHDPQVEDQKRGRRQ